MVIGENMEQNTVIIADTVQDGSQIAQSSLSEQTLQMKRAYNRGGLGLIAEFGIFQQIGSMVMILAAVIASVAVLVPRIKTIAFGSDMIRDVIEAMQDSGVIGWVVLAYAVGMCVGMTVGLIVMRKILTERIPIEKKKLTFGQFVLIALAAYGLWGLGVLIGNFPSFFGVEEQNSLDQLLNGLTYEALPMYLYMVIGAPVFEELVCRKFLLDRLHPYGEGYAVAVTALLFGIIHGNSGQFFLAFLLGALFAVVYLRTGKIIYTMILHAMINLTATIPNFLQMAGITIDTEFMIGIFVLAAIGWAVILFGRKHLPKFPEQSEVPDATRATWKNVGMMLARILGLVSLVSTDLLMMTMSIISSGSALPLLKLIPITLAILTVLLLPGWTRRFEKNTAAEDCQETSQAE